MLRHTQFRSKNHIVKAKLTDLQDFPGRVVIFQDFAVLENAN